ncbi:J domain-containing protein [Sphingosinicellaceae bacterium]|nr:J domain-containing protein [Sphingosinicellaceae bacterium]
MILPIVAVALLAYWLHTRGELIPAVKRWGAVAALGLLALRFLETGNIAAAALAAAGAAFWGYASRQKLGDERQAAQARKVLGVTAEADADQVHAAWRRALATAHPDAGGSSEATAQATAARDLLLARLARR